LNVRGGNNRRLKLIDELHKLYSLINTISEINHGEWDEWDISMRTYGRDEKCFQILVGRPEVKRPLRKCGRVWEDNARIGLK
jgi:hypothetical protein